MSKVYETAVYIGRFQPIHNIHIQTINHGLDIANNVLILVGSVNRTARDIKNPWTFDERKDMILSNFPLQESRIKIVPIKDYLYNDNKWVASVQTSVTRVAGWKRTCLIGSDKDDSTYYLKLFPNMEKQLTEPKTNVNATTIRNTLWEQIRDLKSTELNKIFPRVVSKQTSDYIERWIDNNPEESARLAQEYVQITEYKKSWECAPYTPTFVTTDAVVLCAGHVLVVTRKESPGKDLYALPGGFLNPNERLFDGCIRELREETKLKVPAPVIRGSFQKQDVFDAPNRSLRGRTITHAFLFQLSDETLPKVKGSDDAKKAEWMSLADVRENQHKFFEDHVHIIEKMTSIQL